MTDTERKREGIKETGTFQKRPRPEEFPQSHPSSSAYLGSGHGAAVKAGTPRHPSPQTHPPAPPVAPQGVPRQQKRSRPSTCDFCLRDLEEAIPHSCGHWLCGECITSHSEKSCPNSGLQEALAEYKDSLKRKCASVSEGTEMGRSTQLQQIYTDLFITEGLSEEVMTQHEYTQMEANSHKHIQETPIKCQEIFKPLPFEDQQEALQQEPIRLVLTLGVAGVGKTFSVLKFSLDWAQGSENQDLDLVLPLSFRELNLVKIECYSLLELIHVFHPSLRPLSAQIPLHSKVLFILDGLDESRFPLDFSCEVISEITQGSEVGPLLVNLIRGDLLPNALIWITSRPAAASQIPAECAQRITELRGFFTDQQKAQYFRRRFSDADQCRTVLSHIRGSRCLYTMCQIPVFCWITATVLDHMLRRTQSGALPQTLTDLYVHFLLVQTQRNLKYKAESSALELSTADCDLLLKLGQLAFEHLYQGNIMFYQEDLEQVGLDLSQVSLCSGLCSEIFKPESVIFNEKIYSFVHFSVQEFMAAVYIYHCFNNNMTYVLEEFLGVFHSFTTDLPLDAFLDRAMRISLTVATGQLDLFVRFLHGLSLESNYRSLMLLLGPNKTDQKTIQKVIDNLKELNLKDVSPDRSINIFHCLTEMNDQSVHQQIQDFLKTKGAEKRRLSEIQCSALAYMLQMSEQVLEELDLNNYNTSREGRWRLIPAVRNCKKANLSECELTETHCEVVASALEFNLSKLKELDLSKNYFLNDSGVNCLLTGLQSAYCALEVLRIKDCMLTWCSCYLLASALWFNPFHLKELDLSDNFLRDLGMEHLSSLLQNPDFRLQILRLRCCSFSALGCSDLSSALQSNPSHLRELDLSYNELQDSAVEVLCHFLHNPLCALQILRLIYCRLSEVSCCSLASALSPSHLRALDLSDNVLLDSGVELLCSFLQTPDCELQTLRLSRCSLTESSCSALASALRLNPSHLRVLDLSKNPELKDPGVEHLCDFLQNPLCELEILSLKSCGLSNLSCLRLVSALRAHPSLHLRELDLRKTNVTSAGHFGSFTVPFTIKYTASLISNSQTSTSSCMSISVPEEPEPGPSHHRETTVFLPEVSMKSEHVSFRFRCPDSGAFRCSSTGLVFVVTKEAELQYKIIQWDEALLKSSGRTAAGPLYDIECSERAMCELHLPHCEPEHVDQSKSQLSVAHISDSGLSLMEPERITQSHVVICVSGLSVFGLLWKFFDKPKVVSGQVLLFCTPQKLKVNIFLLPRNISVDQVEKKQRSTTQYIDAPSKCRLVIDQHYTVVCPRAEKIQPKRAPFDMDHEPNFHSSFELRLPPDCGLVSISVREERHTEETEAEVWRHELDLKACGALSQDKVLLRETTSSEASMSEDWSPQYDPTTRLRLLRSEFVKNVSNEVLNQLLDKLQEKILNPEEAESIRVRHRADKARYLVDTVLKKGQGAASVLVHTFCTLDSESDLCQKLRTVD
ncbi:NACHT, LRR and PYD domains-containing protein 12-like [Periophthalmus magnuspinnatus]|uniref:NACHT, LRR and PYD domains-containing protein 12-like n=1 Tax=Periophthalmus magnuspinnatus TaxID=409849 RepID=UPI002436B56B|nr:NACHT, LRR and PYD domains-containing protein 12-like [Periophthalmus magnuspinnatus]